MLDDLSQVMETQYFRLNLRVRDEKTRKQYRFAIANFSASLGRPATVGDLDDDNLAAMMHDLLARGLAPRTVNDRRWRITALWRWLHARGRVQRLPTVCAVQQPENEPRAWRQADLQRLIYAAAVYGGRKNGIALSDWWLGLLLTCWDSGARTSELLSLRWEWLDFSDGVMRVPAAARKGKRKPATYWLKPFTLEVLGRFRKSEGLIFPAAKHSGSFYHRWKRLLKKAGLPTGRSEGPQKLRRSYATWIAAAGGDATAALMHSSPAITHKSYLDRSILEKPQNAVLFDLRPPG